MESAIAPFIDETMHKNQQVYIKSHPMIEPNPSIELHLITCSRLKDVVKKKIDMTKERLYN